MELTMTDPDHKGENMKVLISLIAAGLLAAGAAYGQERHPEGTGDWLTDFEQAKDLARERQVPILVNFAGSDWCGWCMKLDREVFSQETFREYAKGNLVLFLADFPRDKPQPESVVKQNRRLQKEYGIRGFPTILLISARGKVLARTGYRRGGAEKYVKHLKALVNGKQ
jgi:thioredoxin-related protein